MSSITITRPIDGHCHLRENGAMKRTLVDSSNNFSHVVAMPNLHIPTTSAKLLYEYKSQIDSQLNLLGSNLKILYTLYASTQLNTQEISSCKDDLFAIKLYPQNVTTNAQAGISNLDDIYPLLEMIEESGIPLLLHGETNDPNVDIFDRELIFIDKYLNNWLHRFPQLKVVLEHISTTAAVEFITTSTSNLLAASVTPHHLHANRNSLLANGLKPDYYCLPILKAKACQEALIEAVTSGDNRFYLGTDSAPHSQQQKYSSCGCAGIYNSLHAIELYTEIFAEQNALDKLNDFASTNFAKFHNIESSNETITLEQSPWICPTSLPYKINEFITPFKAGEKISWKVIT
ncbi:MAG: dihydroorotase [Francisellaceae bacterium]|nr:dihydroorotase [Francisellaceae bacterium]MBT6539494.1 dihydroorotase [Francisellaceae bacterium]